MKTTLKKCKNVSVKKLQAIIKQDLKFNFQGKTTTALPEQLKTTAKTILRPLREMCPNTEFFSRYFPVFSLNTGKYGSEKKSVLGHFSRSGQF